MVYVKSIILDILKPHQPNALEFSKAIAEVGDNYHVHLDVIEVDEKTESVKVTIYSDAIDFEAIKKVIVSMGASLHSIDEVEVQSGNEVE